MQNPSAPGSESAGHSKFTPAIGSILFPAGPFECPGGFAPGPGPLLSGPTRTSAPLKGTFTDFLCI